MYMLNIFEYVIICSVILRFIIRIFAMECNVANVAFKSRVFSFFDFAGTGTVLMAGPRHGHHVHNV